MRLISGPSPAGRAQIRGLALDHRHDRQDLGCAAQFGRRQQHLTELGVQREGSQRATSIGQFPVRVHSAQEEKGLQGTHHCLRGRRVHEIKMHNILHSQVQQSEDHGGQIGSQNLRDVCVSQLVESILREQSKALPRLGSPSSPSPLLSSGLGDRGHQQGLDVHPRVVHLLLREPRVHHEDHPVQGDRRLRDVRGDHHLAPPDWGGLEHVALRLSWESTVERHHTHLPLVLNFVAPTLNFANSRLNLLLPGEEHQDVTWSLVLMNLTADLHGSGPVVLLSRKSIKNLNRKHSTRHGQNRGSIKIILKSLSVQGRGHHHAPQRRTPLEDLFAQAEQDIGGERPFVGLVQHQAAVLVHGGIRHALAKQHTIGHVLDLGLLAGAILKPDQVPHMGAQLYIHLLRYTGRDGHGSYPSGLGHGDLLVALGIPQFIDKLGHLGGLPTPRLSHQNYGLVVLKQLVELILGPPTG
mmetsp:Transcript_19460/g.46953  ORF Transcript_19460/g.46953 Transcript_19460/m.46953 type:complete len:467 (+) Transcript_19460:703-2103(+)